MGKRPRRSQNFEKRWKAGVGQGEGDSYQPWITVQSFASKGRPHRPRGWKTNRPHHLLSDGERRYFYVLEWSTVVTDIREQYPLWTVESTTEVANHLGIKPPMIPGTSQLNVLTTDFLITIADKGESRRVARTFKNAVDLDNSRVIEKLEIERLWWVAQGVDWGIVTEQDLPQTLIKNVHILHSFRNLDGHRQLQQDYPELVLHLSQAVQAGTSALSAITSRCDAELGLDTGSCLALAKHLIATRRWVIDMNCEFRPTRPLEILRMSLEV